jgi:GTPase SAR1 family protein
MRTRRGLDGGEGGRTRRTGLTTLAILCGTIVAALLLSRERPGGTTTTLISVLVGGGSLAGVYLAWAAYSGDQRRSAGVSLQRLADQLARALGAQWEAEARLRRLNDPYPLPVTWSATDAELVDDWDVLERLARSGAGWPGPPPAGTWAAGPDELSGGGGELAAVLTRVPTGRLLVLGEPGAGKTMLMVRLVLDMLTTREPGAAVPFLVPLASWNPGEESLRGWLASQLAVGRPEMLDLAPGRTGQRINEALLDAGLILPVLDGLDELPQGVRESAIVRVNDELRAGETVVITCRTADYWHATAPGNGLRIKLRAAAGVELDGLATDTIASYLIADAGGQATARRRWGAVLDVLGSAAPVAQALSTPLMIAMARVIYNPRPGELPDELRDPAELCDPGLADRRAVEAYLFDAFIPAAYRGASTWTPQQADPWLRFLAYYLETKVGGPDLAWWQLQGVLRPRALRRGRRGRPLPEPSRKIAFRRSRLKNGLKIGVGAALVLSGLLGWLDVSNLGGFRGDVPLPDALVAAVIGGVAIGMLASLVGSALFGFTAVSDDLAYLTSPGTALARDRRATFGVMAGPVITIGAMVGLLMGGGDGSLTEGLVDGLLVVLVLAVSIGLDQAWLPFVLTRVTLAAQRQLPRRLMSFLADAHQRGVLRQDGAVYQFRHIELQRRLAAGWKERPRHWWRVRLNFSPHEAATRAGQESRPGRAPRV